MTSHPRPNPTDAQVDAEFRRIVEVEQIIDDLFRLSTPEGKRPSR